MDAAEEIGGTAPRLARQIFYQARPKIMAMTDDKELQYGYFSQTLLPDYIEEHGVDWNVVYDARGHFEEPHTNRRIGCGTIEVGNYLQALKGPEVIAAEFADATVDIIGPSGNISGVLFCEKEGFNPLFKAVNLANRYDVMIVSTKGVSVTAATASQIAHGWQQSISQIARADRARASVAAYRNGNTWHQTTFRVSLWYASVRRSSS